jgi:DNA-directed RNA polymerase specialized sigma subunit
MKIPLHGMSHRTDGQQENKFSEAEIQACKLGDWEAKHRMVRAFTPLLTNLAHKRAPDGRPEKINALMEAGKAGLIKACRKYSSEVGAAKFQLFALNFIEDSMDSVDSGLFARLKRLFGAG